MNMDTKFKKFRAKFKLLALLVICGLLIGGLGIYLTLQGSLPILAGIKELPDLTSPVHIHRDALGIPSIYASNRIDVARALGFLHAQDRFFQMDLMRRAAAGELSELFGSKALEFDKARRLHRFRFRAEEVFSRLSQEEQDLLQAYTEMVNAGLSALTTRPFEYYLLGAKPVPWRPEDSLLACFSLFFELQDSTGQSAIKNKIMEQLLPQEVFKFFAKNGSAWEAALDGSKISVLPVPASQSFEYLNMSLGKSSRASFQPKLGGSNQWAVTKDRSKDGKALLACDMHLELNVPNTWYRAAFHYQENNENVNVFGATIPGAPLMIIGSNTHIAWGFTNGYLNTSSIVVVDPASTKTVKETILIKDEEPFIFEIKESSLGPILPQTVFGSPVSLSWIAYSPDALNLQLIQLEKVKDVHSAIQASKTIKVPVLNFLVADRNSNIAWTLFGAIPNQNPADYPVIINPIDNALWSANNRTLGGEWLAKTGGESYLNGIRAYQIQQSLLNLSQAAPKDMLALQMEIKAPFFERWQRLLIEILESSPKSQKQEELLSLIRTWNGLCTENSAAYYWIRKFRKQISTAILERVLAPCLNECHDFLMYFQDFEEPVWLIAQQRPSYLTNPNYNSWNAEFLYHIDKMMASINVSDIKNQTWGKHNILAMNHPFSSALPGLGYLLDMPSIPMSGDYYVPKVAYRNDGASQRMVVSPGNEKDGIFHMPGGQCSHPLSPFYQAGHEAWMNGEATPFLPGKPIYKLTLQPLRK